jgi:tRNA G18 (ribose-2'-O)-methylase SpoU
VRIPMLGKISSLNASVAGALMIYEVVRNRKEN